MNWKILLSLCVLFLVSTSLFSQSLDRASIGGRLTDESGAVVTNASILLVNEETGHRQTSVSGKTGDFDFPFVTPGSYALNVQASNFQLLRVEGIRLTSNQNLNLPIVLKVGPIETEITVNSALNNIDTASATIQHLISENELKDMPIITDGHVRGVLDLLPLLVPGANPVDKEPVEHGTFGQRVSINGSPVAAVGFTFNGIDNYNFAGTGGFASTGGSGTVGPNPDALGEFSVLTHTFKAENGSYPVVINLQTKSGTNSLHGQVRGIYQDPSMNARDFFAVDDSSGTTIRTWGAQLSGPVVIPKLYSGKNKTLFFIDVERSWWQHNYTDIEPTISLRQRAGDFSELPQGLWPKDPLTGAVFPGGVIPANRILPQSQHYIDQFIVKPNREGQWVGNGMYDVNGTALNLRIDQQFSANDNLNGSLFYSHQNDDTLLGSVIGTTFHLVSPGSNFALHYAHQLSSRSVNSLTFGLSHFKYIEHIDGQLNQVDLTQFGYNIHQDMSGSTGFPRIILPSTNYFNPGGEKEGGDYTVWTLKDDFALSRGAHALKFGGDFRWWRSEAWNSRRGMPTFLFLDQNPGGSGNDVADLLLGIPLSYSQGTETAVRPRRNLFAAYFQDDFKLSSNLTLNLGLRYELNGVWTSADGKNAYFRLGAQSMVFPEAPPGMLFPGDTDPSSGAKLGYAAYPTDYNNLAPRVGLAYLPSSDNAFLCKLFGPMGSTSIRAGYGIYYFPSRGGEAVFPWDAVPPWSFFANRGPYQIHDSGGTFANPWGNNPDPFSAPLSQRAFNLPVRGLIVRDPNLSEPYQQQWTFSVQRQLPQEFILELAYLGNTTVHLHRTYEVNPGLMTANANPFNVDSRRAYQDYGPITGYASDGLSNYQAFQVRLNRRFTSHFLLNAHYVWSKAMDNAGGAPPNAFTFANRDVTPWARSNTDSRNQFVLYGVWELPQVKHIKVLDKVASGWQVGGIVRMGSGIPYNIRNDVDSTLQGIDSGSPDLIAPFRKLDPRQVQTFTLPNGRAVTGNFLFDPTVFRSVFPTSPDGARLGNLGRNVFTGPGVNNFDLSLLKSIVLHENHRIDFRVDVVNLFNHAQFAFWYYTQGIGGFQFGSTSWTTGPREIQLYLRYSF